MSKQFIKIKYCDIINEINNDIQLKLTILSNGDDLGSEHEKYIMRKNNSVIKLKPW